MRCPDCGRFARYDAYYARFWCDYCDRIVRPTLPVESLGVVATENRIPSPRDLRAATPHEDT